jgi:neutral ceramidase
MRLFHYVLTIAALALSVGTCAADWKAGVAKTVITPKEPMWMAGYGARNKPAEGTQHDLYVKALALEDERGQKFVLLTSDLVGIPRGLSEGVANEVKKRTGLDREHLMLTASHTHCGPALRGNLEIAYDMPPEELKKIAPYTAKLQEQIVETIVAALKDMKPAKLSHATGKARFAVNRRKPTDKGIINDANPNGPVDHDVPVLRVTTTDDKLLAVVCGYACHNTTLQYYKWCGDYAGFAQIYLEEKHPGAVAMFFMGCGGDANPLPRSTVELCEKYGKELAVAVDDVLKGKMTPIAATGAARYAEIELPFDKLPDKAQLTADTLSKNYSIRKRAEWYLKMLDDGKKIDDRYRQYPVQVWRLGTELYWFALGGETVVDYSFRMKKDFAKLGTVWVTGYANDVMAYIPSERVLKEGGYEGDSSMIPYGMPTKWAPGLEDKIVKKAAELAEQIASKK